MGILENLNPAWVSRKIDIHHNNVIESHNLLSGDNVNLISHATRSLLEYYISNKWTLFKKPKPQHNLTPLFLEKGAIDIIIGKNDKHVVSMGTHFFPEKSLVNALDEACEQIIYNNPHPIAAKKETLNSIKLGFVLYSKLSQLDVNSIIKSQYRLAGDEGLFVRGEKNVVGSSGTSFRISGLSGSYMPKLNMNLEAALAQVCINGALPQDLWSSQDVKIFKFKYQFFIEDGLKLPENFESFLRYIPSSVRHL